MFPDWNRDDCGGEQHLVFNKEVKESLFEHLVPFYINVKRGTAMGVVFDIIDDIRYGDPGKMVRDLDVFMSGIPYDIPLIEEV